MTEKIAPVFDTIEKQAAAEALSEPFTQKDLFHIKLSTEVAESVVVGTTNFLTMGATYIAEDGQVAFEYAINPLAETPLSETQAFIETQINFLI